MAVLCTAAMLVGSGATADDQYSPTTLTAMQLLSRAADAAGKLAPGAYHWSWTTTTADGTSTMDAYSQGKDYAEVTRDGDVVTASGSRDGTFWEQDENGTVFTQSGPHWREDPYATEIDALSRGVTSDAHVLGVTTTAPKCVVVDVHPKQGLLERIYFDATSYEVRRVEFTDYNGLTRVYEQTNFQTEYGMSNAVDTQYHDGFPQDAWQKRLTTFERIPNAQEYLAIPRSRALLDMHGQAAATIPADFLPDGIIVRVYVNGRGLDFAFDSGAEEITIDDSVARQLGLPIRNVREQTFSGEYTSGESEIPTLQVGPFTAHKVFINTVHLHWSTIDPQRAIVGALGADVFGSARVAVNFHEGTLQLLAPSDVPPPPPWVAVPIQVADYVPIAHASFDGVDGTFIIDLGAWATHLYPHYFARLGVSASKSDDSGWTIGIAGKPTPYLDYTLPSLKLGSLTLPDVGVVVPGGTDWESTNYDGLIGRNVLQNFDMIFDYANHVVYIKSYVPGT